MKLSEADIPLSILIYREDGEFVSHALEMDIVGCGETPDEAFSQMKELVEAQVSFAFERGNPSLIWKDAPKSYFARWRRAQKRATVELAEKAVLQAKRKSVASPKKKPVSTPKQYPIAKYFSIRRRDLAPLVKSKRLVKQAACA